MGKLVFRPAWFRPLTLLQFSRVPQSVLSANQCIAGPSALLAASVADLRLCDQSNLTGANAQSAQLRTDLTVNLRVAHVQDIIDHHVIPGSQGGLNCLWFSWVPQSVWHHNLCDWIQFVSEPVYSRLMRWHVNAVNLCLRCRHEV